MYKSLFIYLLACTAVQAELKLNDLFKEHMVLQRQAPVSVFGTATPDSRVTVGFNGQKHQVSADIKGCWELKLTPMEKSFRPQRLVVTSDKDNETVSVGGILVGDVWLCGGQSNMAHPFHTYPLLRDQMGTINEDAIRSVIVKHRGLAAPDETAVYQQPFEDAWRQAREPWVSPLSPTAYYFAAKLRRDLDVPVGLIVSAVGGTQIQRWMPKGIVDELNLDSESTAGAGDLYNAMIHPLRKFTIKGVIWYQGESNGRIPHSYYALSTKHIECWREIWSENNPHLKDMPFLTVQLAPFKHTVDGLAPDAWAYIRDAQLKTLELPNTGLAVTTDVGEFADIHPQDKQPVGERLALWALKLEGNPAACSGPLLKQAVVDGGRVKIAFSHVGSGLETRRVAMSSKRNVWAADDPDAYVVKADSLAGFRICGEDRKFIPAEAVIAGRHVEVWSDQVPSPVAVRYGWSTFPLCNLFNKEGLPASPFRTDDFPVPDVQGRLLGNVWDREDAGFGSSFEFTGSNPETAWNTVRIDGLAGHSPAEGSAARLVYAYYKNNDTSCRAGASQQGTLRIVYYDSGDGTIGVQYDSSDSGIKEVESAPGAWKYAGKIKLRNSKQWNVVELPLTDAFFSGRCNGADVRLSSKSEVILGSIYYLPRVEKKPESSFGD